MLGISETTTFKDGGRALRSVRAKSHGLLTGSFRVLKDLPASSPKALPRDLSGGGPPLNRAAPVSVNGKPNGFRETVVNFLRRTGAEWELRAQLCTNLAICQ